MNSNTFSRINLLEIIELRALVLALGETHHFSWWKSGFLSATGLSFLERLYPHTHFAAAVHSGTLAAMEIHDSNIGKGRVFHLFRLSQNAERELDSTLKKYEHQLKTRYGNILEDQDKLFSELERLSSGQEAEDAVGPVLLNVPAEKLIPMLAVCYLQAFQQREQVFPYFEEMY